MGASYTKFNINYNIIQIIKYNKQIGYYCLIVQVVVYAIIHSDNLVVAIIYFIFLWVSYTHEYILLAKFVGTRYKVASYAKP